jgi:UDP-GlcNAc:undecaprenyl-phosphate/decaprenyl-phosphate GlcNAc-1-phosphate transferase
MGYINRPQVVYSRNRTMGTALLASAPAAASFALTVAMLPFIRRLSDRFGWHDPPDHRKLHVGKISHLGGVAIFVSFAAVVVIAGALLSFYSTRLAFLLLGAFTLHVIGLVDDLRNLRALPRLVAHLAIAAIVASGGFLIDSVSVPGLGTLRLGYAAYPVTILWIAGVVNALNWSDGMDGYAGGIAGFAALGIGVIALLQGHVTTAVMAFALLGGVAGFLVFNFPPARIFMGDNGATFIGFVLAVLPFAEEGNGSAGARTTAVAILLFVPLLDFVTSILRRLIRGRSPGSPDRGHIHHRLQDLGLRPRPVLAVVYPVCAFLLLVAITVASPPPWLPLSLVLALFLATVTVGLVFAVLLCTPTSRVRGPTRPPAPPRKEYGES